MGIDKQMEAFMPAINTLYRPYATSQMYYTVVVAVILSAFMVWMPAATAAGVFGVLALWLWYQFCLRGAQLGTVEKIFYIFLAGTFALSKNFSVIYITIRDVPLFISEAVLFFLLITTVVPRLINGAAASLRHPLFHLLLFYFLLGVFNLIRGLPSNGLFALRDAAVVYYAAFYLVTVELFDCREKFIVLLKTLFVSVPIVLILGVVFCTPLYPHIGFIQNTKAINVNFLYGLVLIFLFVFYNMMGRQKKWAVLFFLMNFALVVFMQVRTTWVSLTAAFLFLGVMMRRELGQIIPKNFLTFLIIFPLLLGLGYAVDKDRVLTLGKEAISIFRPDMDYQSASNSRFRLLLWEQATRRGIRQHPIIGAGYGADYNFMIHGRYIADVKGAGVESGIVPPHNGYIALFFKMGLLGLITFVLINATFFINCFRFYRRCRDAFAKKFLLAVMASQIHICVGAFFFEAIEVPQVGIFLWVLMGLGVALMKSGQTGDEERLLSE